MRERIDDFDFAKAALGLYDYVYGELCDWYLEMVKPRLYAEDDPERPRRPRRDAAPRPARDARCSPTRSSRSSPRSCGGCSARTACSRPRWPRRRRLGARPGGRGAGGPCDRRRDRAARLARPLRGAARRDRARPAARGGLRGDRRDDRRPRPRRGGRERDRAGRRHRRPRRDDRRAPEPRRRPRAPPSAAWRPVARSCAGRSSAPSASSPTRGSWPRRRPQVVDAEREKLARFRAELEEL